MTRKIKRCPNCGSSAIRELLVGWFNPNVTCDEEELVSGEDLEEAQRYTGRYHCSDCGVHPDTLDVTDIVVPAPDDEASDVEHYCALDHLRLVIRRLEQEGCGTTWSPITAAKRYLDNLEAAARSDWLRDQARKDRS